MLPTMTKSARRPRTMSLSRLYSWNMSAPDSRRILPTNSASSPPVSGVDQEALEERTIDVRLLVE
jgi:hypothetical protein